jgi:gluconate 2-dehydrogenase gamma chain
MAFKNLVSRRHFVHLAALGTGSICLLSGCSKTIVHWRFLTDSEAILLDALAEQIIPADKWPGGRDSGVTNFIDRQLMGPYIRFQGKYRKGLLAIQKSCVSRYQNKFENLDWNDQTIFLEKMEAGELEKQFWQDRFDKEFFGLIRDHSMQAYYGSQRHGGNRNNMSFKMLGLDYPLIIGQNRYNI